jgi:hypothetical protein
MAIIGLNCPTFFQATIQRLLALLFFSLLMYSQKYINRNFSQDKPLKGS